MVGEKSEVSDENVIILIQKTVIIYRTASKSYLIRSQKHGTGLKLLSLFVLAA